MRPLPKFALLLAFAFCAAAAFAQGEKRQAVKRKLFQIPKAATSANGFIMVVAADVPGDPRGFRLPILSFASKCVENIERAYKLEIPKRDSPGLVIHAMDGQTNDTSVIARTERRDSGLVTRISLPSPGFSDIDLLRFEIAKAYFASWIDRNAPKGIKTNALPDWFVQGALRSANVAVAHADTRFVLELWSSARLPFFPALCTDMRLVKGPGAALPGYLVTFARERRAFKPVLERLASGAKWDGAWLAEQLTGEREPVAQDRASDERLARLARAVLSPGEASEWDLRMFASRLRLYPVGRARDPIVSYSFEDAIPLASKSTSLQNAAARKSIEMPMYVVGRGEGLMAAGEAYRQFLGAMARGDDAAKLRPLLKEADRLFEVARGRQPTQ